jgi:antitoxin YefM
MTTVSYSEARANLAALMEKAASDREAVIISRRGKEKMALLPASELAGLLETAYLLQSPYNAERLLGALENARQGKGIVFSIDSLREQLGLGEEG